MKLGVISGYYPGRRFNSHVNHSEYCRTHGYLYIDASQPGRHKNPHFRKIEVIRQYLGHFDWVFWIDDDAYFTDFSKPLHCVLDMVDGHHMLICRSPSTKKLQTKFSSGQFFLRNSDSSRNFLDRALRVDLKVVERSFWRGDLGLYTAGDQDAFVYLTETEPAFGSSFVKVVDHNLFNNRDLEFKRSLSEHFIVHFTGSEKFSAKKEFCARLRANRYLVPDEVLSELNVSALDEYALGRGSGLIWRRLRALWRG